ncbi:3376_t:CDS:2 [Acaulospora morrowiae]|uniref:Mitotic-spindle organizing protein 1 n=1 Tax=Acaulospora morrowiae TaxID=94023 RepID=A0A9N8ZRP3_9GLOM|nr:3376_t:CDS:2 [Acaulospora morrowiae]
MEDQKIQEARETMDVKHLCKVLYEISTLLNTGLDRETLSLCLNLCENGVNPEALAAVIKELRRESASMKLSETNPAVTASGSNGNTGGGGSTTASLSGG